MKQPEYHHIVLFRIHDDVSDDRVAEALEMLKGLGEGHNGLLSWVVNLSIDKRKGRIIIEEALFISEEAYQTFRTSPHHIKAGEIMQQIADWWVGDYES